MSYYPILLDLKGRLAVVVGGGQIAEGKIKSLLEAGACVTVVAPELTPTVREWVDAGQVTHHAREYQLGDLTGAFIVICATDDRAVNERVWAEGTANNQLVNVVDDVPHCNFIAPSIMRRGDLTITVSTNGKAPTLAVRIRERLERLIGDEYAQFLQLAGTLRAPLAKLYPSFEHRKALWYRLVDSDVLDLLRAGDEAAARERIQEIMGVRAEGVTR